MSNNPVPVRRILPSNPEFPRELLEIPPRPTALFIRGNLPGPYERRISIVGSRRMTIYGHSVVQDLVSQLARADLIIVSGLALGVDAACHEQALENNASTIAVLAGGVDDASIAPKTNAHLAKRILESGSALISEYPPGTQPRPEFFAIRNRWIAALSPHLLVIEAAKKSGALITADLALNAGREVWAVPGNITSPQSAGTNALLRMGAHAAVNAQDILDAYGITDKPLPYSTLGIQILETISHTPMTIAQLSGTLHISETRCAQELSRLELSGHIRMDHAIIRALHKLRYILHSLKPQGVCTSTTSARESKAFGDSMTMAYDGGLWLPQKPKKKLRSLPSGRSTDLKQQQKPLQSNDGHSSSGKRGSRTEKASSKH